MSPECEVKVLVVDDNEDQLQLRAAVFQQSGYSVLTAGDGLTGLAAARRERPHLIVSEVKMPRADGIELCRAVRAEPSLSHTPILLLSTLRKETASVVEGLRAGADEYLEAPFIPIRLAALAARLIERKRGEAAVRKSEERYRAFIADSSERVQKSSSMLDEALLEANERALLEYERLLERITALAQSLGVARDLLSVFRAILDFTLASAPCSALAISLYDAATRTRRVVYLWYNGREHDVSGLNAVAVGSGVVGRAVSTGKVELADADYFMKLKHKPTTVHKGYDEDPRNPRSALIAPMAHKGNVVGVVELQCYEEAAYTSGHITAMSMAANLTANAVENVRLYEREREQEEQLRHSQRLESIGKLAGGVAHDFNNLLVAINGYSDLSLRRLEEGDPIRSNVKEIKRAGERAAALTSQLLAFSRKQVMQPKVLSMNDVMTDMNRMLRRLIGEDIELVTALAPNLGVVRADPSMLEQVVLNLCVNSRDAMPRGGRLLIETSNIALDDVYAFRHVGVQPGRYVCLSVSDTGEGMDAETRSRIFEPFFTTKELGKGTGLGLSTVYGIVKQSGGNVWVYSEVGHGSVFKVYLPRVEEGPPEECSSAEAKSPPTGSEKILLVEDNELVRRVAREIMGEHGYEVVEAAGPAEAMRLCEEHEEFALLLTDVVMPQMNGRELAARLLTQQPGLRVVYMSGYSEAVLSDGMLEEGIEFIQKPFTPDALLGKLREVLDADPRERCRDGATARL